MTIINLPNRETFRTSNDEAGEFIQNIVNGGEVTLSDFKELEDDVKEVVVLFIGWNNVYIDNDSGNLYLRDKLVNTWKLSVWDMTFDEFIEEFYTWLDSDDYKVN